MKIAIGNTIKGSNPLFSGNNNFITYLFENMHSFYKNTKHDVWKKNVNKIPLISYDDFTYKFEINYYKIWIYNNNKELIEILDSVKEV